MKQSINHFCSVVCSRLGHRKRKKFKCAFCGEQGEKPLQKFSKSKSKLHFCSRRCKDLGQSITYGLEKMWPKHYNRNGGSVDFYRRLAWHSYKHYCAGCGYDKIPEILEVHHIDRNRKNNKVENLILLCSTCHTIITLGYGKLVNRKLVMGQ